MYKTKHLQSKVKLYSQSIFIAFQANQRKHFCSQVNNARAPQKHSQNAEPDHIAPDLIYPSVGAISILMAKTNRSYVHSLSAKKNDRHAMAENWRKPQHLIILL